VERGEHHINRDVSGRRGRRPLRRGRGFFVVPHLVRTAGFKIFRLRCAPLKMTSRGKAPSLRELSQPLAAVTEGVPRFLSAYGGASLASPLGKLSQPLAAVTDEVLAPQGGGVRGTSFVTARKRAVTPSPEGKAKSACARGQFFPSIWQKSPAKAGDFCVFF
jgi:hypothetical protein